MESCHFWKGNQNGLMKNIARWTEGVSGFCFSCQNNQEVLHFRVSNLMQCSSGAAFLNSAFRQITLALSPLENLGEFERAHLNCFPELGKIRVCSLKVRRKSCFYYLSELFPLKYAFWGAKGWFLHIAAHHSPDLLATKTNGRRSKRKKRKMKKYPSFKAAFFVFRRTVYFLRMKKKKCHQIRRVRNCERLINGLDSRVLAFESGADGKWEKQGNLRTELECPNETSSETVSVSGIINRYFSSFDEVSSNSRLSFMDQIKSKEQMAAEIASDYQNIQFGISSPLVAKTPPKGRSLLHPEPRLTPLRDASKTNVGIHLVQASKSLGLSTSKQSPALSLAKFIDGRSLVTESPNTHIRNLIFEIMMRMTKELPFITLLMLKNHLKEC